MGQKHAIQFSNAFLLQKGNKHILSDITAGGTSSIKKITMTVFRGHIDAVPLSHIQKHHLEPLRWAKGQNHHCQTKPGKPRTTGEFLSMLPKLPDREENYIIKNYLQNRGSSHHIAKPGKRVPRPT